MAYYRVCEICGGSLDPGEKCDCVQESQGKEQVYGKMFFVDQNGQMTFAFTKEEQILKAAV